MPFKRKRQQSYATPTYGEIETVRSPLQAVWSTPGHRLSDSTRQIKGLTAVVGRPQMGKSWLLTHIAWQLSESNYLVGYQESVGQGDDLILSAVIDLYTFWLSNATYRDQAKSLFRRHKDELITSVGRAVGTIVEPLSKTVGLEVLGKPIRETLEALVRSVHSLHCRANSWLWR